MKRKKKRKRKKRKRRKTRRRLPGGQTAFSARAQRERRIAF